MVKAIGIVNLHSDVDFVGLTERRPVASVSFLGRYALIDFVLSNMSNSTCLLYTSPSPRDTR